MAEEKAPPGGEGITPTVPIRGIRMKFAVLEGLIQAGEVTNRDIVETVFNLVSLLVHKISKPEVGVAKTLETGSYFIPQEVEMPAESVFYAQPGAWDILRRCVWRYDTYHDTGVTIRYIAILYAIAACCVF